MTSVAVELPGGRLQDVMSNEPMQPPMQVNGREMIHDLGESDFTIITDKACYRAAKPYKELPPGSEDLYRGVEYPPNVIAPIRLTHPDLMRSVMKCCKSVLAQHSRVFQEFLSTMPGVSFNSYLRF